mgnify:FL=1
MAALPAQVGEALGHGRLLGPGEQGREGRLAGEDEGDDQAAIQVEVGEETEHGQRLGAEAVGLIEEEAGSETVHQIGAVPGTRCPYDAYLSNIPRSEGISDAQIRIGDVTKSVGGSGKGCIFQTWIRLSEPLRNKRSRSCADTG